MCPSSNNSVLLSHTALQTFVLCLSTRASRGQTPGFTRVSSVWRERPAQLLLPSGSDSGFPGFSSSLLPIPYSQPGVLLLVCCSLTPSTLLSLGSMRGDRGKRKWDWVGEGLGRKASTGVWNSRKRGALRSGASLQCSRDCEWGVRERLRDLKADSCWTFCWGIYSLSSRW